MKKKILFILGTRPEAVKVAPLYQALKGHVAFEPLIALTGQHPEMADEILSFFGIVPDFKMVLNRTSFSLSEFTAECLREVNAVIEKSLPDLVFVHGDTSSTFCGALAAYYHKIPVAHLEAGLRTGDKYSPFPEEMMRKMTGSLAEYHFAPTENAKQALLKENTSAKGIFVVGNSVIDALLWTVDKIQQDNVLKEFILNDFKRLGLSEDLNHKIILVTGHRRENFGGRFEKICHAIRTLSQDHPDYHFVYPVHLNPNVQKPVNEILGGIANVHLIPPVNYPHFVYLMMSSQFILTDSGGIQEEAPTLGKPVLVMRDTTERPEAVEAHCAKLVGTDHIVQAAKSLIQDKGVYNSMSGAQNPYGNGKTAQAIVNILEDVLKISDKPL
jgi:UDP-N-acetylglucosamine 2-epimerase (non-hydrolysing)